ncbi:MAG: hypothetical protein HYZ85_00190 [Candidatus Omnitrophica bacterium]|nr:hypothetical protein [Candidatus Omnitrophota bacterium]
MQNKYYETETFGKNTLAPPLRLAEKPAFVDPLNGISLLKKPLLEGFQGAMTYQALEGSGYRLRFDELSGHASFFLVFEKSLDLRNRWFHLRYAGTGVNQLAIVFDHDEGRRDRPFFVYLESSVEPENVYFKLPSKFPYSEIHSLRLIANPDFTENHLADFMILGLDLLPEDSDPLASLPETDLGRFDWYSEPLQADNEVSVNMQAKV